MNETLRTISKRYSCRNYTGQTPDDEALRAITEAAIAAPSGLNKQGWRVIALKNRELMGEIEAEALRAFAEIDKEGYERIVSRGGKLFYNAPVIIIFAVDSQNPGKATDVGIACENAALAAASLGVDSVICGLAGFAFAGEKTKDFAEKLKFPVGYEFGLSLLLGFAIAPGAPHEPDKDKIIIIE
jgi:nitroreductase